MAENLNANTVLGTADNTYTFTRDFDTDPAMETLLIQQLWSGSSLTSGTGTYVPFLNQNATGQDVASQGFNTSDGDAKANNNGAGLDMSNTASTKAIQLKDIPIVVGPDGQSYYEIRLDINEENNAGTDASGQPNPLLALSEFQLYWSNGQAELEDYNSATYETRAFDEADGFHLAFDLDANEDRTIQLRDSNPGGGKDDYVFFIPVSAFAGVDPLANITLFSQFGPTPAEGATPEEWRIRTTTSISGEKFNDSDGDGVKDAGETSAVGISGITIKLYQDSTTTGTVGVLDGTDALVTSVVTGANGAFTFYSLLPGTYFIDEDVPAGWTQTSGDYETVTITTPGANVTGVQIGNFLPDPKMALTKVITSVTDGVTAAGAASSASTAGVDEAGDVIYYTITLTNTGNVALTNVNLTDALEGTPLPGPTGFTIGGATESGTDNDVLDVGESWTWLASYTVQAGDIANNGGTALPAIGQITNTADATAKYGDTTIDVPEQTVNTPIYIAAMSLTKVITSVTDGVTAAGAASSASTAGVDEAGDVIYYTITLTNTGNVALTNVNLTDALEGTSLPGPVGFTIGGATESGTDNDVLDVGESWTWLASYTVQAGDIANNGGTALPAIGQITNTADATAKFGDTTVNVPEQTVNTPIYAASMALTKVITSVTDGVTATGAASSASTAGVDEAGDVIYYTITLTNTGNVALTDVNLTDALEGTPLPGPVGFTIGGATESGTDNDVLDVGESWTWLASYTVQAGDIANNGGTALPAIGQITNTADATAKFGDTTINVPEQTVNTPIYIPAFTIDKAVTSVTNGYLDGSTWIVNSVGDKINYTITITNTGNVALTQTSIVDTLEATVGYPLTGPSGDNGVVGTLEVGEVWTFTTEYTVTAADFALSDDDIDNRIEAKFNFGNTQLTGSDSVETPIAKVDLEKGVATAANGPYADADVPTGAQVGVAQDMYFQITVTNTGKVDLDNVVIWDISTAHGNALNYLYQNNDLTVFANSLGATIDKGDGDNVLSVGETWTIKYVEDFEYGQHINTGYVTNDQGATDNDAAHYVGKEVGPGVRTPGFWSNWQALWDGDLATKPKQQGTDGFADHDLLFVNNDGGPTGPGAGTNNGYEFLTTYGGQKGLLIGDWNKDGVVDADGADNTLGTPDDEDVLFIKLSDAQVLINASSKQIEGKSGDGVMMLGRDVVATWLNYLAGNPIDKPGVEDDGYSPKHYIQDAVDWLQTFGDANNSTAAGPGNGYTYDPNEMIDTYSSGHAVIKTSTAYWSGNIVDGTHSAAEMHGELDFYNNTGAIHDEALLVQQYANPGG